MISTEYANAYTEILEIIKFIPDSDYEKIPEGYIQVFQKHSNTSYDFKYNPKKLSTGLKVILSSSNVLGSTSSGIC